MKRLPFILALTAFFAWISWLGYLAANKSYPIVVSHSQLMLTNRVMVGTLTLEGISKGEVNFESQLKPNDPNFIVGSTVKIVNLSETTLPYNKPISPGTYLFLLNEFDGVTAVAPRPNGLSSREVRDPMIYPWTPGVELQIKTLLK
jgi:hypothetical protein